VKENAVMRTLNDWAKSHDAKFALIDKQEGFLKLSRQAARATDAPLNEPVSRQRQQPAPRRQSESKQRPSAPKGQIRA